MGAFFLARPRHSNSGLLVEAVNWIPCAPPACQVFIGKHPDLVKGLDERGDIPTHRLLLELSLNMLMVERLLD